MTRCREFCSSIVLFVALCVLATACVKDEPPRSIGVGDKLPAFSITDNHGNVITNANLPRPAVVVFFNTSCGDCQHELPQVQKAYEHFAGQGVGFICIARDEKQESIDAFWQANAMTVPFSPQNDRKVYEKFATQGIPRIYVVGRDGIIAAAFDDSNMPSAQTIIDTLNRVL